VIKPRYLALSAFAACAVILMVFWAPPTGCSRKEEPASSASSKTTASAENDTKPTLDNQFGTAPGMKARPKGAFDSSRLKSGDSDLPTAQSSSKLPSKPETQLPRMVDFGAVTCTPCKMMAPILDELQREYAGKVEVSFVDVSKNQEAGRQARLRVIPTQVFIAADGRELFRHEGFYAKAAIIAKWRELGFEID